MKRKVVIKEDISVAANKSEMFDFLIDLLPRESDYLKVKGEGVKQEDVGAEEEDDS
jgi:hypothetical protein